MGFWILSQTCWHLRNFGSSIEELHFGLGMGVDCFFLSFVHLLEWIFLWLLTSLSQLCLFVLFPAIPPQGMSSLGIIPVMKGDILLSPIYWQSAFWKLQGTYLHDTWVCIMAIHQWRWCQGDCWKVQLVHRVFCFSLEPTVSVFK